eukprot:gene35419-41842_t
MLFRDMQSADRESSLLGFLCGWAAKRDPALAVVERALGQGGDGISHVHDPSPYLGAARRGFDAQQCMQLLTDLLQLGPPEAARAPPPPGAGRAMPGMGEAVAAS